MQNENSQKAENQTVAAFCECCDNQQTATVETLVADGWLLGKHEQFCPVHND